MPTKLYGIELPDCDFEAVLLLRRRDGLYLWRVTLAVNGETGDFRFTTGTDNPPSRESVLLQLIHSEANHARLHLRDFVGLWKDQGYAGRMKAVSEWKRLVRQRRELKRIFKEACP